MITSESIISFPQISVVVESLLEFSSLREFSPPSPLFFPLFNAIVSGLSGFVLFFAPRFYFPCVPTSAREESPSPHIGEFFDGCLPFLF